MMSGFSHFADDGQCFLTLICDVLPVSGGNPVVGKELAAHPHTGDTCLEPGGETYFGRRYATCHHQSAPWQRCTQIGHELRRKHAAGETLDEIATQLLGLTHLTDSGASGYIGHTAALAHTGHLGVEQGADHEVGTHLQIERGSGSIDHRTYT